MAVTRQDLLIKDISNITDEPWTVKVTIAEKTQPRDARGGSIQFQKLVGVDSEKMRVQILLFNENIWMFSTTLALLGTYFISNASVKPSSPLYPFQGSPYQWTLNSRCVVKKCLEDAPTIEYIFRSIADLPAVCNSVSSIDMLFAVVGVLPMKVSAGRPTTSPHQEVVVIDQGLTPIILTLWDDFVKEVGIPLAAISEQKPLLAGFQLKVVVYNGISVATTLGSSFRINPTIPAASILRSWMSANETSVKDITNWPDLEVRSRAYAQTTTNTLRLISYVHSHPQAKFICTVCRLDLCNLDQKIVRSYCPECYGTTTALPSEMYTCKLCSKKVCSLLGPCIDIECIDTSGTLNLTLCGDNAAIFLGFANESTLLAHCKSNKQTLESLKAFHHSGKQFEVQLKGLNCLYKGSMLRRFTAHSIWLVPQQEVHSGATSPPTGFEALKEAGQFQFSVGTDHYVIDPTDIDLLQTIRLRQEVKKKLPQRIPSNATITASVDSTSTSILCSPLCSNETFVQAISMEVPASSKPKHTLSDVPTPAVALREDSDTEFAEPLGDSAPLIAVTKAPTSNKGRPRGKALGDSPPLITVDGRTTRATTQRYSIKKSLRSNQSICKGKPKV